MTPESKWSFAFFCCGTSIICLEGAGGGFNTFNCLQLTSYLGLQLAITDWRCRQARWSRYFFRFLNKAQNIFGYSFYFFCFSFFFFFFKVSLSLKSLNLDILFQTKRFHLLDSKLNFFSYCYWALCFCCFCSCQLRKIFKFLLLVQEVQYFLPRPWGEKGKNSR